MIQLLLSAIEQLEQRAVLATIIGVEGHSYRKPGVCMLLIEDGTTIGSVSPGCMESDLMGHLPSVLEHGESRVVEYDQRPEEDWLWGEISGCGGLIRILLEPVTPVFITYVIEVKRRLNLGQKVRWLRTLNAAGHVISQQVEDAASCVYLPITNAAMMVECTYEAKPRLIVFGAGSDVGPLSDLARRNGFQVTLVDWRAGLCDAEHFPQCTTTVGYPAELVRQLNLTSQDYVIIMSHHFQRDEEFLEQILPIKLKYIGILGSATRTARLLAGRIVPEWLHYPVGIEIGSEGPEEIAVSIVAELIQIRRKQNVTKKVTKHEDTRVIFGRRLQHADGRA